MAADSAISVTFPFLAVDLFGLPHFSETGRKSGGILVDERGEGEEEGDTVGEREGEIGAGGGGRHGNMKERGLEG